MFYDPIGLIPPIILQFRLIIHKVCTCKSDWDTELPSNYVTLWNFIELKLLEGMPVSGHVLCNCGNKKIDVHGFCESSGEAYAACIYIFSCCCHGVAVNLVANKCRLAPSKSQTIPWLELLSCLLLS